MPKPEIIPVLLECFLLAASAPAMAQTAPPAAAKPPPNPSAKPAPKPDPAVESYKTLTEAERIAIQNDLIWIGDYNGTATQDFGARAVLAVKAFQKRQGVPQTGLLDPKQRGELAAAAKRKRDAVAWRVEDDAATGARIGIPRKLVPTASTIPGGSRWASARGEISVETFRSAGASLPTNYEAQRKLPDRKTVYSLLRPDFYVVAGLQGQKKFYVRGHFKDGQIRGFTVLYDQAMAGAVDPIVVAMSSAFAPFGGPVVTAGPPPRRKVEYGTAVVVSEDGYLLTTRELLEGCQTITLAGYGPADRVREEQPTAKVSDLALLRLYGARGLNALALSDGPAGGDVTLVGIADPQAQGGGGKVSTQGVKVVPAGGGVELAPPPGPGFAGAAALDRGGRLAGIVDLAVKPVAGPASAASAMATLISAPTIRAFLAAHQLTPASGTAAGADAGKASVVRVICVRK